MRSRVIALTVDEVVGTEPNATGHGHQRVPLEVEVGGGNELWLDVTLEDERRLGERFQGLVDHFGPIRGGEVAAKVDPSSAPGGAGEAGNLEDQLAFTLGEAFQFLPVGEIEAGYGRVRGEWSGVDEPGLRNELLELGEERIAEFTTPKRLETAIPEQGEEQLFFEDGFQWRRELDAAVSGGLCQWVRGGDIGPVEQFEEAVDGFAGVRLEGVGVAHDESGMVAVVERER